MRRNNIVALIRKWNIEYLIQRENFNHKVKTIEIIEEVQDVYDMEVPETHNFGLSCGIFVHNCDGSKDIIDGIAGSIYECYKNIDYLLSVSQNLQKQTQTSSQNYLRKAGFRRI